MRSDGESLPVPQLPSRAPVVGLLGSEKKFRTFFSAFAAHCATRDDIATVPLLIGSSSSPHASSSPSSRHTAPKTLPSAFEARSVDDGTTHNAAAATAPSSYPAAWDAVDVLLHKLSDDLAAASILARPAVSSSQTSPADDRTTTATTTRPLLPSGAQDKVFAPDGSAKAFYSESEQQAAKAMLNAVDAWQRAVPGRVVFEGLDAVSLTTRRTATQAAVLRAIERGAAAGCARPLAVPFTELVADVASEDELLQRLGNAGCHCLVKSDVACGKTATHHMRFVASMHSTLTSPVVDVAPQFQRLAENSIPGSKGYTRANDTFVSVCAPPYPRVIQRVVADAAAVVKVYVLGKRIAVRVIRNAIPWIPQKTHQETWFSSQNAEFFPVEMESVTLPDQLVESLQGRPYNTLEGDVREALVAFAAALRHPVVADPEVVHAIVTLSSALTDEFGFCMFGFDLAVGADASTAEGRNPDRQDGQAGAATGVVHVLDVNYFPGYKGIGDVNSLVADLVVRQHSSAAAAAEAELKR